MADEDDDGYPPPEYTAIARDTLPITPDVPRKSILKKKAPRTTKVGFQEDSIQEESIEQEYEKPTLRNKRSKSVRSDRSSAQSNISRFSQVSLDPGDPAFRVLTALVVFKILFWDVASSIGDNITDFLQGFNLILNLNPTPGAVNETIIRDWDTARYGVGIICINWLPGLVAVIHMLAFHRSEYITPANEPPLKNEDETDGAFNSRIDYEKKDRLGRKKRFMWSILICLLAYPIVPTVMHILVIWRMNSLQDTITFSRTQQFASIARSISGCIESPIQVTITLWLIMKDIIPIPWATTFGGGDVADQYGNTISFPKIPMVSMIFSILNILASVIQINIMSVYIGHVKNMAGFKKFVTLAIGHLPFFLSTIIFRITALSFILIYLDWKGIIIVVLMFLCNLLIGYTTYSTYKLPKKLKREIKRMKSIKRKEAKPSEANHPTIRRQDTTKENAKVNAPVWLNSFLSLCVPCCYIADIDHTLLESMEEKYKIEAEKRQKAFQKKVMQYQVLSSSLILLTTIGIICYLVNTHNLKYGNNRFNNLDFNISCSVLLTMAIISLTFVKELDVFEFFRMNEEAKDDTVKRIIIEKRPMSRARISKMEIKGEDEPDGGQIVVDVEDGEEATVQYQELQEKQRSWGMPAKILWSLILTALTLAPPIIGYQLSRSLPAVDPAFTLVKFEEGDVFKIRITKAFIVNQPDTSQPAIIGKVSLCTETSNNNILAVDLEDDECLSELEDLQRHGEMNKYKAIILIENWDNRASSPYPDMVGNLLKPTIDITKLKSQDKTPLISIRHPDRIYFGESLKKASEDKSYTLDISFKDLSELLEIGQYANSPLFQVKCEFDKQFKCLHFFRNPPKNGENFLGCTGEPKKRVKMDIKCKSYNKTCPELEGWKKTLPGADYTDCAMREESDDKDNEFPPLTCKHENRSSVDYQVLSKISCNDEEKTGQPFFAGRKNLCTTEKNFQYNSPGCHEGATCKHGKWGRWSANSPCIEGDRNAKEMDRYRFCKEVKRNGVKGTTTSTERCVIMEKEWWESNTWDGLCVKKIECRPRNKNT